MAEVIVLGPLITFILLLILVILVVLAVRLTGGVLWLLINSLIGIFILALLNIFPFIDIPINIWTVLIVAIGGIPGILLILFLDLAGIAF